MKKIFTLLLALAGMVSTASATDYYLVGQEYRGGADWYVIGQMSENNGTYSITYTLMNENNGGGMYFAFATENAISNSFAETVFCGTDEGGNNVDVKANPSGIAKPKGAGGAGVFYIGTSSTNATSVKVEFTPNEDGTAANYVFKRLITVTGVHNSWAKPGTCYLESSTSDEIYTGVVLLSGDFKYHATNKDKTYHDWGKKTSDIDGLDYISKDYGNSNISGYNGLYFLTANFKDYKFIEPQEVEAVTTNSSGYCTYVNTKNLTIEGGATAYYAIDRNNGCATAVAMTNPVAGTPMLIRGESSHTYYFPVAATGDDNPGGDNAFKAGTGVALDSGDEENGYNYILNGAAFYKAADQIVRTGKAYLQLSKPATSRALVFDDEETGVNTIVNEKTADQNYYNLSGQRVVNPAKGLYIQDGKKVIMK